MKRFLLLTAFAVFIFSGFSQQPNYSKVKVYANQSQLIQLAQTGIDITEGTLKVGEFIICDYSESEIAKIQDLGMEYEILIEDVSKYYVDRNIGKSTEEKDYKGTSNWTVPENFEFGSMSGHATWEEVIEQLDNMVNLFPDIITEKESIGQTIEGRDIWMVKISDNPSMNETEPEVLYTSLHHAREPAGLMTLLYYMWYLLENYDSDPFIQTLVDNSEMYFVPVINADGYVYNEANSPNGGGMWRKNRRDNGVPGCMGVDPNRNYGYMWGYDNTGSSPDPCDETYRGESAFSEPELAAMRDFCEDHEFKNALNYHTHGNLLLYVWGWTEDLCPDDPIFYAHSVLYTQDNNYTFGPGSTAIYPTNGGSDDWMYGEQTTKDKIFSYTPELGGGNDGFWCAIDRIIPIAQENMIQNILAAAFTGKYAEVVETSPTIFEELNGLITFDITRLGLEDGGEFSVNLEPLSDVIASVGDPNSFSNMDILETQSGDFPFYLHSWAVSGTPFQFVLSVDNGDYILYDTISKIYGESEVIFEDDGNTLTNWVSPVWEVTTNSYFSPTGSITDSPGENYPNNHTSAVILNQDIDLSELGYAQLTFQGKWEIEQGWDYVQLMVSTEGGGNWQALEGKFTVTGNSNQALGQPLYDGFQTEWVMEEIDLSNYIGEQVTFRFLIKSDNYVTEDGFYFDDFTITGVHLSSTGKKELSAILDEDIISNPFPNPATSSVKFLLDVKDQQNLKFALYNSIGQIIYTEVVDNGVTEIELQLSDWNPGVYYYRIEGEAMNSTAKKLIIK